jgi:hypothetical protein
MELVVEDSVEVVISTEFVVWTLVEDKVDVCSKVVSPNAVMPVNTLAAVELDSVVVVSSELVEVADSVDVVVSTELVDVADSVDVVVSTELVEVADSVKLVVSTELAEVTDSVDVVVATELVKVALEDELCSDSVITSPNAVVLIKVAVLISEVVDSTELVEADVSVELVALVDELATDSVSTSPKAVLLAAGVLVTV